MLVVLILAGCTNGETWGPQPLEVVMAVPDFETSFDSSDDTLVWGVGPTSGPLLSVAWAGDHRFLSRAEALAAVRSSLHLTRDGVDVPGEVHDDWVDINGMSPSIAPSEAFSFVPTDPLEGGGWYVLSMDLAPWRAAGETVFFPETLDGDTTRVDDAVMARFRVDSFPVWVATRIRGDSWPPQPGETIELTGELSEVITDWGDSTVQIFYDGDLQSCSVQLGADAFRADCDTPPDGVEVEIRMTSTAVRDAAGSFAPRQRIAFPLPPGARDWARPFVLPDFDPNEEM